MHTRAILLFMLVFCTYTTFGQPLLITCKSERNADNSISIIGESQAYGIYTVKIIFSSLLGYQSLFSLHNNIALATIETGRKELLKLMQNKSSGTYDFQYRYQYYPGRPLRKLPDTSFLYLLPATAGKTVRISKVGSLAERLGQTKQDDYSGTGFVYQAGDSICAARAGIVYEADGGVKEAEKTNESYKSVRNRIRIQQRDGTLCTYDILAPIHLLVTAGDVVLPGMPMAVFNKTAEKYMVLLSTYYLDENKLQADNENNQASPCTMYIPAHFYSDESNSAAPPELNKIYTSRHPATIVTAELSKKEKKKLGFQ